MLDEACPRHVDRVPPACRSGPSPRRPVGAAIGDVWGRTAFVIAAAVGIVALTVQLSTIETPPPVATPSRLPHAGRVAGLQQLGLVCSAHQAVQTAMTRLPMCTPFLGAKVPALGIEVIALVLLAYGVERFFSSLMGGWLSSTAPSNWRSASAALAIAVMTLDWWFSLVRTAGRVDVAVAVEDFFFGLPVGFQTWTVRAAADQPDRRRPAGRRLQIAITTGAVFGGLLIDGFGPIGVMTYAANANVVGAAIVLGFGERRRRSR